MTKIAKSIREGKESNVLPPIYSITYDREERIRTYSVENFLNKFREANKIWYGEMKIPIEKIDKRPPRDGLEMRVNLYRIQGPPEKRKHVAWQPTDSNSYHVPEAFGRLRLKK